MNKIKLIIFSSLVILSTQFWSCVPGPGKSDSNEVSIVISRFEEDLFSISAYGLEDSLEFLIDKYPEFFPLFTYRIIEIGGIGDPGFETSLIAFVTNFTNYQVSKRIEEVFPDLTEYENELGMAFERYKNLLPGNTVPELVTCISGFNQSVITADSLLAISLDKYLGQGDEFYQLMYPPIPAYMRRLMSPEKIVPDAVHAWIITEFPYNSVKDNLLSQMIFHGRAIYCTERLLPDISDTLLWGYTSEKMDFCTNHEKRIWEYLIENKKLFMNDGFTIAQFINDAPFTKELSQESPGRAVVWQGYKIVESFVRHNKDISLQQLMDEDDYQKILNLSRYNP